MKETHEFQAETKQLLDLMVHSIYTNQEIFLRELISNASDAIDKVHIASLTDRGLLGGDEDYEILLALDKDSRTLTVSDNGIGMSRGEVIDNIGVIAKSGTKAFVEKLKEAKSDSAEVDTDLIGQFGVGFYSAFMVAKRIVLITRKAGEELATRWESDGTGSFTVDDGEKERRGTSVVLYLADDFCGDKAEHDFTDQYTVERLVKKYSDYVRYPIKMNWTTQEYPRDKDGKIPDDAKPTAKVEVRTLNSMQPLWTRDKKDITKDEYAEFYKSQFKAWDTPMDVFHTKAEGAVEYTALMYIPGEAAFNLYHADYEPGLQLYSRHVFIMDRCKDLLPDYLRFVKGLVDSPDLSLNISRELLQQSRELKLIGRNLEKTVLKSLAKTLKDDRDGYEKFWTTFGKSLKIGVYNSVFDGGETKDKLKDLLMFATSKEGKLATLKEYRERMPESQKALFYATGKDAATINELPQMEMLRDKGLEVLYLIDPVDEFALETLREYDGKPFQSISRGDLDLGDAESEEAKKETAKLGEDNGALLKDVKAVLGDKVGEVKVSSRLKTSAVCLVADAGGPSLSMEQTFADLDNPMFKARRVLELNPKHALFARLQSLHARGKDDADFVEYCNLLYTQALLIEGILPDDPVAFANQVARLMAKA